MTYPELDPKVSRKRHERAVRQMRVGDIVDAWLDCTPDPGMTRPLPVVILRVPALRESYFHVKSLFEPDSFDLIFCYQWKCIGHIAGIDELIAAEEAARISAQIARSNDTSLSAIALEPR